MLGFFSARVQWIALARASSSATGRRSPCYPLPGRTSTTAQVGVPAELARHHHAGFAAHWDKNSNLAWAFDTWFLNLFPRAEPFTANGGGYATLSFIPTLGTMILGLLAGGVLPGRGRAGARSAWLVVAGGVGLAAGWGLGELGVCPVVKRIWTPSWVLFSGGWCFLFLAGFYAVIDLLGVRFWAFPLRVIGMNSIAAYCMADGHVRGLHHEQPQHPPRVTSRSGSSASPTSPCSTARAVLLILWLILFWMYRRGVFLRI